MPAVRNCLRRRQMVVGRLLGGRRSTSSVGSVNCNHINRMNLTVDKIGSPWTNYKACPPEPWPYLHPFFLSFKYMLYVTTINKKNKPICLPVVAFHYFIFFQESINCSYYINYKFYMTFIDLMQQTNISLIYLQMCLSNPFHWLQRYEGFLEWA